MQYKRDRRLVGRERAVIGHSLNNTLHVAVTYYFATNMPMHCFSQHTYIYHIISTIYNRRNNNTHYKLHTNQQYKHSQNPAPNPTRQRRNRLPNLLLRPPLLPRHPLPLTSLHRLPRIHPPRSPLLPIHLHSRKFHRGESAHDTTGAESECAGECGVLWEFGD